MAPPFPLAGCKIQDISRIRLLGAIHSAPVVYGQEGAVLVRVHESAVLKYGNGVSLAEARNTKFIRKRTRIRVPMIFDAWEERSVVYNGEEQVVGYILMEFINGSPLCDIWPTLINKVRSSIYAQIADYLRTIHDIEIERPGPVGGGISRGPLFTDYGAGPFLTSRHMEDWFNERLLVCKEFNRVTYDHHGFSGKFRKLVMCHMDVAPRNMILDGDGNIWLLDWAHSGEYPELFETAVLLRTGTPEFTQGLLKYMDNYQEEAEHLLTIGFALMTAAWTKPSGHVPQRTCT
ncbi:hypothetical protein BDFG_01018 [Blastomyces dermatitidis ATCC 26199]|nr:hypothetical protein BDFG_01018 [Blastomyces dermatitidis ATCC 26199]